MKTNALIVDDEEDGRNVIIKLLKKFCPEIDICGEAGNINQAYELAIDRNPQVVFLDIQMPGGSGFQFLKKFTAVPFEVIFVTSYNHYALEAIKFSALDYLLKPIDVDELVKSVRKLERKLEKEHTHQLQIVNVLDQVADNTIEKRIVVHHHDKVLLLPLNEITHMDGERNYTIIHTLDQKKYTSSKNLLEFEEMLESYPVFFRISKSCIVNINHISGYSKGEPCVITLSGGQDFEISRRKKQEFLARVK